MAIVALTARLRINCVRSMLYITKIQDRRTEYSLRIGVLEISAEVWTNHRDSNISEYPVQLKKVTCYYLVI